MAKLTTKEFADWLGHSPEAVSLAIQTVQVSDPDCAYTHLEDMGEFEAAEAVYDIYFGNGYGSLKNAIKACKEDLGLINENKTFVDLLKLIKENEDIFIQKVKNKLKGAHKLSDEEASELVDKNKEDIKNSYKNKENENKASTKLVLKKKGNLNEADNDTYFNSFTEAAQFARQMAEKRGYEIDEDDWMRQVATGGRYNRARPAVGETHTFTVELTKNGKPQRKALTFTVYGMESGKYELVSYIN